MWLEGHVLHGDQTGRTIGFPTINLDPSIVSEKLPDLEKGVHAAYVKIQNKEYKGALYYGPRVVKQETKDVLEIFVPDFSDEVNGEVVEFEIVQLKRPVMDFDSLEKLKEQIQKDITAVREQS